MNTVATEAPVAAPATPKKTREVELVTMSDGRSVEFVGKAKMLKAAIVTAPDGSTKEIDEIPPEELAQANIGQIGIRLDFRNGSTRTYPLNPAIGLRYAGHGGLQKYGDSLAGGVKNDDGTESQDLEDWALVTDGLHDQLMKGEWSKARTGTGGGGISTLLQALVRFTGRTIDEVKAHIADWTPQQKQQLRLDPEIKPIIDQIEQEKAAKNGTKVDVSALKSSLRSLTSPAEGEAT